jgi:hypothetical protein
MPRQLLTTWAEHDAALEKVMDTPQHRLCLLGRDLKSLRLELGSRQEVLRAFLAAPHETRLQIVVHDGEIMCHSHPRLLRLLETYSHRASLRQTPDHLRHLPDTLVLADASNGLIRLQEQFPRSIWISDDADELSPYQLRFDELWDESPHTVSTGKLGL